MGEGEDCGVACGIGNHFFRYPTNCITVEFLDLTSIRSQLWASLRSRLYVYVDNDD